MVMDNQGIYEQQRMCKLLIIVSNYASTTNTIKDNFSTIQWDVLKGIIVAKKVF